MSSSSLCRQNFSQACEDAINNQINMELLASYTYKSMYFYFSQDSVALPGLANFFKKESEEENEHAMKFIDYISSRGGQLMLKSIEAPKNGWNSAFECLESSLEMEKAVNASLLNLHSIGGANNDPHLCDFIESDFLDDQVKAIKKLSDFITQLKRCGTEGLGLFIFDKKISE